MWQIHIKKNVSTGVKKKVTNSHKKKSDKINIRYLSRRRRSSILIRTCYYSIHIRHKILSTFTQKHPLKHSKVFTSIHHHQINKFTSSKDKCLFWIFSENSNLYIDQKYVVTWLTISEITIGQSVRRWFAENRVRRTRKSKKSLRGKNFGGKKKGTWMEINVEVFVLSVSTIFSWMAAKLAMYWSIVPLWITKATRFNCLKKRLEFWEKKIIENLLEFFFGGKYFFLVGICWGKKIGRNIFFGRGNKNYIEFVTRKIGVETFSLQEFVYVNLFEIFPPRHRNIFSK